MNITLNQTEFNNKSKIRQRLEEFLPNLSKLSNYGEEEIFKLVLSAMRSGEWEVIQEQAYRSRIKHIILLERVEDWIKTKVIPNTILIKPDDNDLLKLTIFSLAMPYKMFKGETRATLTEKTRRTKARDFEQIFSDTFIGKIGEVAFKKYAANKFRVEFEPDWEISRDIDIFKSDIPGSKKIVSIKSTDTLESIWAEAPHPANYGIFVKVAIPKDFLMKILAHISSLKKLLNFIEDRLDKRDHINELLKFVEETAYHEEMTVKVYISGFFKTSDSTLKQKGQNLSFLGEVHEDKHLIECSKLKYLPEDWVDLFSELSL